MATLYGDPKNFRTQKVLAAAKYGKVDLTVSAAGHPGDFPMAVVGPAYVSGEKRLFGADAIAWELCGERLKGQTAGHQSEVIQWLLAAESDFLPACLGWVLPSLSLVQQDKKAMEASKADLLRLLSILDSFLLSRTFLVGQRLSLADLSLAFDLSSAFYHVLEGGIRKNYVNVTRWFNTVMHQAEVMQVVGTPKLCEKTAQFDGKKFKEYQSAAGSADASAANVSATPEDKRSKKKKEKPAPKENGPEAEPKEEMDETERVLAEEPKKKDPFDLFPKGSFVMDEFKRVYSNEDTIEKAIPYFWEHFEPDNYSIWFCEYKYPEELTLVFMSCNLISGMFQRLDKMRKNSFGSMILFGENNNSTISGVWFWRGHELAFELSQDWQIDYESYSWTKLDPADEKTKKLVNEYFAWEGEFGGKSFNQGKIFK